MGERKEGGRGEGRKEGGWKEGGDAGGGGVRVREKGVESKESRALWERSRAKHRLMAEINMTLPLSGIGHLSRS